jgi:hypothetical protein
MRLQAVADYVLPYSIVVVLRIRQLDKICMQIKIDKNSVVYLNTAESRKLWSEHDKELVIAVIRAATLFLCREVLG